MKHTKHTTKLCSLLFAFIALFALVPGPAAAAEESTATTKAASDKPNILVIWGDEGPPGAEPSENAAGEAVAPDAHVSLRVPLLSRGNLSFGAVTESSGGEDASELNRQLTNPVSSIWSIANQFNNFELNNGHWSNNWNFQPVLPLSLTKDWNLITRPVMPFYDIVPHPTIALRPTPHLAEWERDAGLGYLSLVALLS